MPRTLTYQEWLVLGCDPNLYPWPKPVTPPKLMPGYPALTLEQWTILGFSKDDFPPNWKSLAANVKDFPPTVAPDPVAVSPAPATAPAVATSSAPPTPAIVPPAGGTWKTKPGDARNVGR